ncbi:endonuclease/exonuclease/phosphatase family protein [Paracoccus xiamenensis]|uniref:endonuclease/exonuclease/phosphatase family protein n=1 Tax=Paracoccus xiamenensis TaxID=2714901 RepID=UPI00140D1CA7|nr:endonuclease/exonuclease/phosphatase family protein [Paracoccus xiamenensis]NHF73997.1 endonuclease/exonuclease/phosphatase family protein [Paracoccus xiamenensis]
MGLKRAILTTILAAALASPAAAETIRIASFDPELTRKGPGLLLRDIQRGKDPQILAAAMVIARVSPDVLLLTGFDWDHDRAALRAFSQLLARSGADYPHLLSPQPNRGMASGADLDGDGRLAEADDSQGWGSFTGQNGMAILSRIPLGEITDYSAALWRDQPGNLIDTALTPEAAAVQRLSTNGHWDVEILTQPPLHLLAFAATAPVFDGPEDRNGRRNHDEIAFWTRHLPDAPFVLAGNANLDPQDGDGRHEAIRALLADPRLTDPLPRSEGGVAAADAEQTGDPSLDTADWPDGEPGNLRVTYVLPSAGQKVTDTGVFWPAEGQELSQAAATASPHKLVWIDLEIGG